MKTEYYRSMGANTRVLLQPVRKTCSRRAAGQPSRPTTSLSFSYTRRYVRVMGPLRRKARNRFRTYTHSTVARIVLSSRSAVRLSTFPSSAQARLTAAFLSLVSISRLRDTLPGVSLIKSELKFVISRKRAS